MKVLKIYDKLNRNILQSDGAFITIKEYYNNNNYIHLLINTKLFSSKSETMSYFSYENIVNGICQESISITSKYIEYKYINYRGNLINSNRINLKDPKSFLHKNRIYDEDDKFIEIENYKGNKTLTFGVKNEILTKILNK